MTTAGASFGRGDDLRGARFADVSLAGAHVDRADLTGLRVRGSVVVGVEVDDPWLGEGSLLVNGVDVAALVHAELERRFPGRALRSASDPPGLRAAWAAVEDAWARALERVADLPAGTAEASVDGEWSFAETLRHLVMATDVWLGGAVLGRERPYHPFGLPHAEYETDGYDMSAFSTEVPTWDQVLEARRGRQAMVRDHLAGVTDDDLLVMRRNPWAPDRATTTLSCLQVVLGEEWEHLRIALRDLDAIEAGATGA